MLDKADRDIPGVIRFLAARGLEAGYLVPTETGLAKSIMDAHGQLVGYFRQSGLHDYASQQKGSKAKVHAKTWIVEQGGLVETTTSLYRPETKAGDPRLWIHGLGIYAEPGNLLALLAHDGELYVVNTSVVGMLESADEPASPLSRVFDLLASSKSQPLEDKFSEWNLRLLRSFFSEASRGEEVFLRVDKELLGQIGQDIGGDKGFLGAIRTGPAWAKAGTSLVERSYSLVRQRTNPIVLRPSNYKDPGDLDPIYRGSRAPTYLPYLAALVRNDAEHPNGYYEGLRNDLKLYTAFGSNEMQKMERAWGDLEAWTKQLQGKFGWFKLRILGGYSRIGVARSQSILQQGDVEDLSHAFVDAEVRPGHELTDSDISRILDEARASQRFYSAAFRSALGNAAFEQPIRAATAAAYADWDGTLPARKGNSETGAPHRGSDASSELGMGLCLVVVRQEPLELAPLWSIPPLQDSGRFKLRHSGLSWEGDFNGTEGAASARGPSGGEDIWRIAGQADEGAVQFEIECFASGDPEPTHARLLLPERRLWILTPSFDGLNGDIELREGNLPASGQAYLLAPPRNADRLRDYLQREEPEHSIISAMGLPAGWLLACLQECAALSTEQRLLPDGEDHPHPKPRAIRFVGGRSVRRGYSKMYLPYDLPVVELDAPVAVKIECSQGMRLEEEAASRSPGGKDGMQFRPRPRYKIDLANSNSASYEVKAFSDGDLLGQAKLRIAGLGGELVDTGQPSSLDRFGRPIASRDGLSGVLPPPALGEAALKLPDSVRFNMTTGGIRSLPVQGQGPANARAFFLDSLAQAGSVSYGVARDQLMRLLRDGGEEGEPPLVLLDLRSRGHIEIATTPKGHMSRIHAVAPTIYELPLTSSGKHCFGVTGALRLPQWDRIAGESSVWAAYLGRGDDGAFRSLRLLAEDRDAVRSMCSKLDLGYSSDPAVAIAEWSSDIGSMRDEAFRNPMESIGSARDGAKRFNASTGRFNANPAHVACELWKVRDLDTGMDNVYVLSDGGKFAFVRDSRWGVWIAMDAFARWVGGLSGMDGVHPMPITYSGADGTLWLPARISLPFVLERALVFCSGDGPEVFKIQHAGKDPASSRIALSTEEGWPRVLTVNRFYDGMAKGRWLAYRSVPKPVATLVAQKLGAKLDEI